MYLVEFNGLPGSGKSTVSKELNKVLLGMENSCLFTGQVSKTKLQKAVNMFKFNPLELWLLYRICKINYNKIDKILYSRIIYSEQILGKYRMLRKREGICISDQGIIQTILSIFYISKVEQWNTIDPLIISLLDGYRSNVLYINTIIDVDDSLYRLRKRQTGKGTRYDLIQKDEELKKALEQQQATMKHIRDLLHEIDAIHMIDINMYNPVDTNCALILSELRNLGWMSR